MTDKPNVEIRPPCPKCGSTKILKHGWKIFRGGVRKQTWKCKSCGHIFYEGAIPFKDRW